MAIFFANFEFLLQHHGTFIHPWERYYGDFVDYAYEYPVSSKPPAASNNAYCGCYDNLHGTVSRASRRTSGKCKHCHKSRQPPLLSAPTQLSQSPIVSAESALKKLTTQVPLDNHHQQQQSSSSSPVSLFGDIYKLSG